MMKLFVVVGLLALASAVPMVEEEYQFLFTKFIDQHNKQYTDADELFARYNIFKSNLDAVSSHNDDETRTFDMAMNEFGDLSNEEFRAIKNGYIPRLRQNRNVAVASNVELPSSVDWREHGVVTPVKNQGQCGSCWAFSTTGSVEGAHALKTGNLVSFSEQELVDCSGYLGNQGCNGGQMDLGFEFIQAHNDCTESDYPYDATDGTCKNSTCEGAVTPDITGHKDVPANNEDALAAAVATTPVSVAVDAGGLGWQFYSGGVMSSACGTQLDHGVLTVGFGNDAGTDYWLVKNSWGESWGESGYIRLKKTSSSSSSGECGIAMDASYPTY